MEAPCVKITGGEPFDWMIIASTKILELWSSYGSSPTLREFAWSALVTRALSRNFALLSSVASRPALLSPSLSRISHLSNSGNASHPYPLTSFAPYRTSSPPITGLLALHVRRGDYAEQSQHPGLTSGVPCPPGLPRRSRGEDVERGSVWALLADSGGHRPEWVASLVALFKKTGWDRVSTSLDMELGPEEYAVSQAVDMSVMVAAETFIGVGFSSLTSNVVQLRLAAGRHPGTTRFW
ncbi:hypothetical protein FB45DRAFT_1064100 [Roridomyces roridus]|uniref:Uncharacterized protein n=1 Tax=Roridomyces roridus TaxID=1738132 RepID=A0AAD7BAT8_9AGAR|nr:hypothetical protein FB45DRAFT_1064100 [Roridomyces roridus]